MKLVKNRLLLPMFLMAYFVFNAQTRIQPEFGPYKYFCLFDLRKYIGLSVFEWAILFICVVWLWSEKEYRIHINVINKQWLKYLLLLCSISIVLCSENKLSGMRTALSYLRPIIILSMISFLAWQLSDVARIFRIGVLIYCVNLIAAYIQWLGFGYTEDYVSGFMDDAHAFSFLMYFGISFLVANYWITKKLKYLFLLPIALAPTMVASADKMTLIFWPSLLISYVIYRKPTYRTVRNVILSTIGIIVIVYNLFLFVIPKNEKENILGGLVRFVPESFEEFQILLSQVRIIDGYLAIPSHYHTYPYAPFIGVGPSMYGSAEVVADFLDMDSRLSYQALTKSPLKNFALGGDYYLKGYSPFGTSSTSFASSDILVLLIEFGLIFSILYGLSMVRIWNSIDEVRSQKFPSYIHAYALAFKTQLIVLGLLAIITFQDGIVRPSNIYPFWTLWGMLSTCSSLNMTSTT